MILKKRKSVSKDDYVYRLIILATVIILGSGTIFFHIVEKWSWLDSYYYSVVTLTTVGYGDITAKTDLGRLATTIYIFMGVGIIAVFVQAVVKKRGRKIADQLASAQTNKQKPRNKKQ